MRIEYGCSNVGYSACFVVYTGMNPDIDEDGVGNFEDNCPWVYNPDQTDTDSDGICCQGQITGNVDCSEEEEPDMSDITRLIDYLYQNQAPLCCPAEADCNGSGGEPDMSDITAIIEYLYQTHSPLALCP